ncbi:tyrosine-type recombinase/integrase [Zhengella sp. ZM62]|uniref:tyrosine-type recombinase/integrase n=1 Tax=Zhengella sedimenti TaxID=3390035 RepID=UPI003974A397
MPTTELTDRFCQSAKAPGGKQIDYFDTLVKGLCLRVSPAGTRAWNLVYTKPGSGKRARMKLGRYGEMTLSEARAAARNARANIGEGTDPIQEKKEQAASQTVADLVENYVKRHAATKRSGDEIARRLRKNISQMIGAIKLTDLHRRDLTRCIDAVKDRDAPVEANRLFEDMRAMVRWARGRGDLDENLVEGMRRPADVEARERYLTVAEIKTMWSALPETDMRESTRRIIRLCLVTGQRVGEITGMTRDEVDLDAAVWTIPGSRAKNGREHVVPLSDMAVAILREQIEDVEALAERKDRVVPTWVFPGPGFRAAVTGASVPKAIKRLEKDSAVMGIEPWTPHDLRRTAATHMEEIGISPFIVGHVLNHVSVTKASITSRVYARYTYDKEKREALDLWADRLTVIIEGQGAVVPMRREMA